MIIDSKGLSYVARSDTPRNGLLNQAHTPYILYSRLLLHPEADQNKKVMQKRHLPVQA
jgi:hypothetical protein